MLLPPDKISQIRSRIWVTISTTPSRPIAARSGPRGAQLLGHVVLLVHVEGVLHDLLGGGGAQDVVHLHLLVLILWVRGWGGATGGGVGLGVGWGDGGWGRGGGEVSRLGMWWRLGLWSVGTPRAPPQSPPQPKLRAAAPPHLLVVLEEPPDLIQPVGGQLADVGEVLELRVVRVHRDDLGGGGRLN